GARQRARARRTVAVRAGLETRAPRPLHLPVLRGHLRVQQPGDRAPAGRDRGRPRVHDRGPSPPHLRLVPPLLHPGAGGVGPRAPVKIDRVEVRRIRLPLRFPFETSFGRQDDKEFLLVSVSAQGATGYAECVADVDPFYLPETNDTVLHILRDFLVPL